MTSVGDAQAAREMVDRAERITVLTGAGISTDSGIPDFRGPKGIWTKNPEAEKAATLSYYQSDEEVRKKAWRHRLNSGMWDAEPNLGHQTLTRLQDRQKLNALITQNIDGLHCVAGIAQEAIVEVHGNVREVQCLSCDYSASMSEALDRVRNGEEDPSCPECGGILKSATISFGQSLRHEDLARADDAARNCDLMLAVGTSLSVYPICDVVPIAKYEGAEIIIVNEQETQYDTLADIMLRGQISEVLPEIIAP